jgi:hypothetical protein
VKELEVIADHEHGGGRAHWQVLEGLARCIGLSNEEIAAAQPLDSTRMAWLAWEALMSNRPWIEGIVANTCAERINVPGYGTGLIKERGWFGMERVRWKKRFDRILAVPWPQSLIGDLLPALRAATGLL